MHEHEPHQPTHPDVPPEPLPLGKIDADYTGRWVLVKVTEMGPQREPLTGQVVAAGTRKAVHKTLSKLVEAQGRPELPYFVFSAGSFIPIGPGAPQEEINPASLEGHEGAGR